MPSNLSHTSVICFDEAVKGEDKRDEAPKFQFKVCLMSFIIDAQGNGLLSSGVTVCCSIVTHNFGIMTTWVH